jgi:hypothetical protein
MSGLFFNNPVTIMVFGGFQEIRFSVSRPSCKPMLGPSWGHLGGHLGAILGPSWDLLGPYWAHLGAILAYVGPVSCI